MTSFFKEWCREAFYYLEGYGFVEEPLHKKSYTNPYQVIYSNGSIKVQILGEGYGSIVSVYFITPDNEEVYFTQLDSEPTPTSRKKKNESLSQKDQIFKIAKHIRNNQQDILLGKYSKLIEIAKKIANDRLSTVEQIERFLNDPEAQAEREARVAASEAGKAYKSKDYRRFIEILEPHHKYLTDKQKKQLEFAKTQLIEK
jgi:hypothetical protein